MAPLVGATSTGMCDVKWPGRSGLLRHRNGPSIMIRRCMRAFPLIAALLPGVSPAPAATGALYRIDQRYGSIEFDVSALGMFDVAGKFPRFNGELLLDTGHPENARIDVAIDADAVEMPLPDQVALVRSADYFNTGQFPTERFVSTSVEALSASHYLIHGTLHLRGVDRPLDLDAMLRDQHRDPASGADVVDFVVGGTIRRSAFGMVADSTLLSDDVHLRIRIHLSVANG